MVSSTAPIKTNQQKGNPTAPRYPWFLKLLVFFACQLLALCFVEFALYLSGLGEEEIFRFDPQIGFCHIPNKRVTWRTEGYACSYFDGDGMREPGLTLAKPDDTYRVALLGDSMVEGLQVPIEKTFGQIVASRLTPLNGKNVQVLNFATSGYSTAQEYLQIKRQVLKYRPDLVVIGYSSRDMFENWAAPDQVITNVRPVAIQIPGHPLVVDSSHVQRWLATPRARFLVGTSWFREHSRIYGLLTALELDWSQHNQVYRTIVDAMAHPKKARKEFMEALAKVDLRKTFDGLIGKQTSAFATSTTSATGAITTDTPAVKTAVAEETAAQPPAEKTAPSSANMRQSVSPKVASEQGPRKNSPVAQNGEGVEKTEPGSAYGRAAASTMGSLLKEMNLDCQKHGAKLAVLGTPCRAQLSPNAGFERTFAGLDYSDELKIIHKLCTEQKIPFFNCEQAAEQLPQDGRDALFYTVHLTPQGQKFIADSIEPFVKEQLSDTRH